MNYRSMYHVQRQCICRFSCIVCYVWCKKSFFLLNSSYDGYISAIRRSAFLTIASLDREKQTNEMAMTQGYLNLPRSLTEVAIMYVELCDR